jgi:hypothetical protein
VAEDQSEYDNWECPRLSVPINGNVVAMTDQTDQTTTASTDASHAVTFDKIRTEMLKTTGQLFDVIHMDPPWQLATANPTRGVALGYSQLSDRDIQNLPIPSLQTNGLLFIWVINAKYRLALKLIKHWVRFLNIGGGGGGGVCLVVSLVLQCWKPLFFFLTWVTHRRSPLFLFLRPA